MRAIPYRVKLLEPLLATRLAGDPNSGVSYPYVPGSIVRGALVPLYMQENAVDCLDAGAEEARRLFFDGRTRYLNAYPVDAKEIRTLPTPHSLFLVKGEEAPNSTYDFALDAVPEVHGEKVQFVAASEKPFCQIDDNAIHFVSPQRRVNVHTQRDRAKGRATETGGAVFQYDALEKGQTFAGWVLMDVDADAERLTSLLRKIRHFGGSSNSGYGRVLVEVDAPLDVAQKHWREPVGSHINGIDAGEVFIVTLLSDMLIRNPEKGNYTWDVQLVLQKALGVAIEYVQGARADEQHSIWRIEEVGGFNRTWGLPLPQAQAIAAGSVFVFQAKEAITPQAIAAVEWLGIGERRTEGFGRVAFNWQQEPKLTVVEPSKNDTLKKAAKVTPAVPLPDGVAKTLATQMAERMLRRELDDRLRKTVYAIRFQDKPAVSSAQLSRMRVIVREALPDGDIERLQRYLEENVRNRRSVRDQFDRTRLVSRVGQDRQERLSRWLEDRLDHPDTVWARIGVQTVSKRIGANVVVTAQGNEALAREYTLRLIDGVLARLAKERPKADGGEQ